MEEVRTAQVDFFNLAGMPNVVGAVDGTHVELHGAPLLDDEYIYTNRKGKHSINVQLICNARYKITNVCARWPGSTHDSRVLRNSRIAWRAFRRRRATWHLGWRFRLPPPALANHPTTGPTRQC
ncbi:putative nuclease HARBI1 [Strongylocentrotus purpuratus]|uniref:DDE Tnp4 domain-containing protein n=1 Tax=Strongylocentrotus purpuratus TaxID=7668 RepID=A0A7M7NAC9_STRPU|nr:putative nuclease HARBI1 [Strongylocentrotus purpuratus]